LHQHAETSDESLAARCAAGDSSAFEVLVNRYRDKVYRLASRLAGEADAPDVLQETFLQAYRRLDGFRGEARFGTWLYRIATNAALMHLRARSRRPAESLDAYLPSFDGDGRHQRTPEELRVPGRVDELVDRRLLAERARAGIERLPEAYRAAFVLRDLEEMTTDEVAELLSITPAAVRQRVHRARLMLRGFLGELAGVRA
jgi:RNA polymerase sigma-70 factor (ECF subfamily)